MQVEERFERQRGQLAQQLDIWHQNNPAQHADYGTEHALLQPHYHVSDSAAALAALASGDVLRCAVLWFQSTVIWQPTTRRWEGDVFQYACYMMQAVVSNPQIVPSMHVAPHL